MMGISEPRILVFRLDLCRSEVFGLIVGKATYLTKQYFIRTYQKSASFGRCDRIVDANVCRLSSSASCDELELERQESAVTPRTNSLNLVRLSWVPKSEDMNSMQTCNSVTVIS